MSDDKDDEFSTWMAEEGSKVPFLHENYAGPPGTIAVVAAEFIPKDYMIYIKNGVVKLIQHRPTEPTPSLMFMQECDGVVCHPDSAPKMTTEMKDNMEARYRKMLN